MSLRFRRSIRMASGVHLNLVMSGAGVGPRGLHVGVNHRGMYTSAGIPGTGLYAVHHYRSGEHNEVRGDAGPFLVGVLIVATIIMVGIAAGDDWLAASGTGTLRE
jgi:hypothetical protein